MNGDRIVEEAKKCIGIKYKDKGRDEFGLDCAGLLSFVANKVGIPHYDTLDYPRRPNSVHLIQGLSKTPQLSLLRMKWDFQNGDMGLFSTPSHPVHLGVLEKNDKGSFLIHAWAPARKVVRFQVTKDTLMLPALRLRRVYRFEEK